MAHTIGNPLSWTARNLGAAGHYLGEATERLGGDHTVAMPQTRRLEMADIGHALRAGWGDFLAGRSDVMFLVLVYPVVGLVLMGFALHMQLLPLLLPLVMGFALLGPVAAVGLYEMSRRREAGQTASWIDGLGVLRSPRFGAILVLGLYLAGLFLGWMLTARGIYALTLGPAAPASASAFLRDVATTPAGWLMAVAGSAVGACFALLALATSVVSFPMLLDRNVSVPVAVATSVRLMRENPRVVLSWGALIGAALSLAAIPLLLGLVIVLPVLGHASWHFYRRAVV
ncbi:DUF2189 domain-containing protein [Antarcticimicrobium luteum]|uniref:DUF2189 domain-containing protein n=1 Tax=Antarcticimicrobium luteum TaxID=2547397 RepID=A0A4R5UT85_9RHOB|nr:DUF2189 domain-containing protein [Antarcticimicrobium luteum]TDK42349.1 DUF2189 domain-containing protein [Antarcticimicrobium luteum]